MKANYVTFRDGKLIWKQIEKKDGKVFMRIKQRTSFVVNLEDGSGTMPSGYSISF